MIALEASETFDFCLSGDADKPEATRPTLVCHHLTTGEVRKVRRLLDEAIKSGDDDVADAKLDEALLAGLAGWRNVNGRDGQPVVFSAAALSECMTLMEKVEAAQLMVSKSSLSEIEKKASRSTAQSATANSAPNA